MSAQPRQLEQGSRHESARAACLQTVGAVVEQLAVIQELLEGGRPVPGASLGALMVLLVRTERDLTAALKKLVG